MAGQRGGQSRTRRRVALATTVAAVSLAAALAPARSPRRRRTRRSSGPIPGGAASALEPRNVVEVLLSNRAEVDRLIATGVDLTEHLEAGAGGITVQAVLTPSEEARLRAEGFRISDTVQTQAEANAIMREREQAIDRLERTEQRTADLATAQQATDEVRVARADYFTSLGGQFLSVEAKSSDLDAATLTVSWDSGPGTEIGSGGSAELEPFVDADAYLYHRGQIEIDERPSMVEVTSSERRQRHRRGRGVAAARRRPRPGAVLQGLRRPLHGPDRAAAADRLAGGGVPAPRGDHRAPEPDQRLPPSRAGDPRLGGHRGRRGVGGRRHLTRLGPRGRKRPLDRARPTRTSPTRSSRSSRTAT